ncbi:MFS transporter [Klenkia brasiliensis]|uniref:Major Facilitator Superfamily protein n=1 Tax=Klenkia brasiliensis TaxID=333142 RepID=A0A1G7USD4_9ACTN|nr:MFS transporter [Klenkia brasiliensis]SDG50019.1 Major Facilitator Superfamily protein [Klenkia brasiliensis]
MSDLGPTSGAAPEVASARSAWRAVAGFGVVSLAADMVYEGARSITGPLLASLGASALLVGLVTGLGEAAALVLRLPFGARVDRSGNYWRATIAGYGLTAVCVPLLAVTPFLGAAGLAVACVLVLAERAGKAVRSPAKSTLLAHAAGPVGLGRGFGVHKALDQVGAFSGPLLVAALVAGTGALWPAMAALTLPGAASIALLAFLRRRVGDPLREQTLEAGPRPRAPFSAVYRGLPRAFWSFSGCAALTTAGLVTFGVISYHLVTDQLVPTAAVPVVYAAAMAAAAVAALGVGWAHDRWGARTMVLVPVLVAVVPPLAFAGSWPVVLVGVLVWGAATGLQDSTVKALVAQLVPATRRATAYGMFAAVQGVAAVAGGALAGGLYARSVPLLAGVVAVLQVGAGCLLLVTLRSQHFRTGPAPVSGPGQQTAGEAAHRPSS